ncbi:MAG TPA: ABC transporter ATP-binding protein [Flavisolibacter sp.]|nr:ABC transporter ATP-binding protein [Flavisolibacter sp.]
MKNPYIALLKTSWQYAGRQRKKFVVVYFLFLIAQFIAALHPLLFGWFIGKVQADSAKVLHYTLLFVGGYVALKVSEWCFHGPARIMERTLAFALSRNFLKEKYHQTLHLGAKWHQDHHSGATINRIQKAYDGLRNFFDRGFMYIYTLTKFVFSVAAILYFSPLFGSIAVVLGMINIWVISRFDKSFIRTLKDVNEKEHQVTSNLFDSLSNIRTVITLRLEKSMERGLLGKVRLVFRPFRKNAITNEWKWFVADMLITVIYCVIVAGFVYQHWEPGKAFYIAGLVTLLGYVNQFTSVFQNVAGQYTAIMQYNTYVQGATSITDAYVDQHRPDASAALPQQWQKIEIRNLNFSHRCTYDEQYAPQSLHNLSFCIERGKRIALIGHSGSGKSTLLSLLRGLYTPEEGTHFLVDGKNFSLDTLNESVTLFPQEPEIFENTVAYNVTLGLPFSDEEILNVCDRAQFMDVIAQLPEGLRTDIREKGVNLSGGQKQRLALARGILASEDSGVILLDEPTSSVDPRTEALIYSKLFRAFSNKAVISSIHRLHLLPQFDYIYVLDQGRIIDEGGFEDLLANSEAFKALWDHQKGQAFVQPFE